MTSIPRKSSSAPTREAGEDRRREEEADRSSTALRSLLGDETLESLERRVEEAKGYEDHRTRHGELAQNGEISGGSSERLGSIDADLQDQIDRVASLRTQAESLEEAAGDPAALKEQIAALEEQIERIEEAKEAVSIARESLGEAAEELKREFAPHLNEALRRDLERITGGRYSEAVVDRGPRCPGRRARDGPAKAGRRAESGDQGSALPDRKARNRAPPRANERHFAIAAR